LEYRCELHEFGRVGGRRSDLSDLLQLAYSCLFGVDITEGTFQMLSKSGVAAEDVSRGCGLFGVIFFVIFSDVGFKLILYLTSKVGGHENDFSRFVYKASSVDVDVDVYLGEESP
jgi:hypothetical protein